MNRLLKIFVGFGLLLLGQVTMANCPNGQFNPYQQVCICPGGGNVAPGQRCPEGGGGKTPVLIRTWGAIAIDGSKAQKSSGFASSTLSQSDANQKALALCKFSTCKVALTFQNTCGAIAGDGKGIWGGGVNLNENKAMQQAVDACYNKGAKDCYEWVTPRCAGAPK